MRIALCYTGYLRTWERCVKNHRDNIWNLNTAWKDGELIDQMSMFFYTYEDPFETPDYTLSRDHDGLPQWVRCPHPFYDDPFAAHKYDSNKAGESKVHHTLNMFHNRLVGFSLVPKGYDIYVNIRPDMTFNGPLKFSEIDLQPNTIYIPKGCDYRGVNDQFAFGDYDTMRKYFSVYLNCEVLWNEGAIFNSEALHLANLNHLGVNIVRLENPQHDLIR